MAAGHEPPQRKILIEVFARRNFGRAFQTVFDLAEGLVADQRFMVARPETDLPLRRFDIPGIDNAR
ncbi:MAG: hypothetical protein L0Y57_07520 [Beijerinckiaceae bacterium]|nr:hypothetical protein [Beijerinckiaceae bacterium]